ncbi:MAG: hypothetical protein ABI460_04650 [Caldimonas sp.]
MADSDGIDRALIMRKTTLAVLVAALWATGCATRQGFENAMAGYVGASEGNLMAGLGQPQKVYRAPDGSSILTYTRSETRQMGGTTTYQPVTSTSNSSIGVASYKPTTTTTLHPVQEPAYDVTLTCATAFRIVDGRVQSWQSSGNNCVK